MLKKSALLGVLFVGGMLCLAGSLAAESGVPAADWSAWKYRMPVRLGNRSGETARLAPVDVTFSFFADQCADPAKEIRLLLVADGVEKEVPFQLSNLSRWTKDIDGQKSLPTVNGMITFFDEAPGDGDAEYVILYGHPGAAAPSYATDLRVSGAKPGWIIESGEMIVELRGKQTGLPASTNHDSGQLAKVTLKKRPDFPISNENGVIHWEPGIFVPTRGWIHAFAWDPPEICEIEQGPLFVKVTRKGTFPGIPEAHLSITYRIFKGKSFVEAGARVEMLNDLGVASLRTDELIFAKDFFSHVGWERDGVTMVRPLADYQPVNAHGDILRLADDAPFVALFSPSKGLGAASVRSDFAAVGPDGSTPTLFDNATYISNAGLQYWSRPLVYFHVGWDRKQLITIPKGSIYADRNLYSFFVPGGDEPLKQVRALSRAVRNKPSIVIGPYVVPPEK